MRKTKTRPAIAYEILGNSGPKVALIMGFSFPHRAWHAQIDGLKDSHQLLLMDNAGVGQSDPPALRLPTTNAMTNDVIRTLDDAGWDEDVHIIGVSMGGMIAQHLTADYPSRVRSMSLIATTPGGFLHWLPSPTGIKGFALSLVLRSEQESYDAMNPVLYTEDFLSSVSREKLIERQMETLGACAPLSTRLQQLAAIMTHNSRKKNRTIRTPTLILKPKKDQLLRPTMSDWIARTIPHAKLVEVESGHGCIFESGEEVNGVLAEFIDETESLTSHVRSLS